MNKLIAYVHVGTHGSCVRSNYHAFESPFTLNGRTARASLLAIPAILTYNLTHIVLLFHPFCAPIWAILSCLSRHSNFPSLIPLPPSEITREPMNVFFYPALCKDTKFCKRLQVLSNLFCKQADQQRTLRPKNKPATTTEIKNHLEKK